MAVVWKTMLRGDDEIPPEAHRSRMPARNAGRYSC
jgi:hypothetical protein